MSPVVNVENRTASSHLEPKQVSFYRPSLRSSYDRCTQCCSGRKGNSRNLVVCIDGTSNQFGQNNTNVVKLFAKINLETGPDQPEQFAYYSSGIGTRPKSLNIFHRMERVVSDKFDMAVAWDMEKIVKDAYDWLARTYHEGDQIYLFGFSRGAYQVRVLVGMIYEVGLIRTYTDKQIGTAYDHYEAIRSGKPKARQIAREFKNTFSWKDLGVHFVGVWDTVSSVGLVRGDVVLPTSSSAAHPCHYRHALALDEFRVKFMPEYFHEMNSWVGDERSKYVGTSDVERAISSTSERREASTHDNGTIVSGGKKKTTEIKEVWFAGCHSDVGGKNRPGKSHQAGNVSLLWMRREAVASGLVLHPTDIVWVPDDLDFGTSNSMTLAWKVVELLPIKHQVSFSGSDGAVRRWHLMQPRRIIPGQKVHASVLYANSYKPRASWGEDFDILTARAESDPKLDDQLWETGLFDKSAAEQLVDHLGSEQGVAPIYLDRLLFMLRFEEGKECVRSVRDWRSKFRNLTEESSCPPVVKLATIVAYYEASCDSDPCAKSFVHRHDDLPLETFNKAREDLEEILDNPIHRDGPRVVTLLRPLTKHRILLDHILTADVLEKVVKLLDRAIETKARNFGQAMDGLTWLLQCEKTQKFITEKLKEDSRLKRILGVNEPYLLTAALRMVALLARTPDGKLVCSDVKPRLRQLAGGKKRQVGILAVETLLVLSEARQLDFRKESVRANVTSAVVRLNVGTEESTEGGSHGGNAGILEHLFGLGATSLTNKQKQLVKKLKVAIKEGNSRERTAATLTILKLCEAETIRAFLRQIDLLGIFINQLQRKDSALLAAYALAICSRYDDMKAPIRCSEILPQNIVRMMKLDYFDDAVGSVEGFQILGELMSDANLRGKISNDDITKVLDTKLAKGKPKETRTGLICLDIFRSLEQDGPWTGNLVTKSLGYLSKTEWKVQKAGVTILFALAQTEHGVAAILPRIPEIIEMLLPEDRRPIRSTRPEPPVTHQTSPSGVRMVSFTASASDRQRIATHDAPSPRSAWMMGPACALRILVQNKTLQSVVRKTRQYNTLKLLFLSDALVSQIDTSAWRIKTPNRTDVLNELDKMIKTVDEGLSEGLMPIGSSVLPHIKHWDRLANTIRNRTVAAITILPVMLGVSTLAILAVIMAAPIYFSIGSVGFVRKLAARYRDHPLMERLCGVHDQNLDEGDRNNEVVSNGLN